MTASQKLIDRVRRPAEPLGAQVWPKPAEPGQARQELLGG